MFFSRGSSPPQGSPLGSPLQRSPLGSPLQGSPQGSPGLQTRERTESGLGWRPRTPAFSRWFRNAVSPKAFAPVESIDLHSKVGQQTKARCETCEEDILGMPLMQDGGLRHWQCIDTSRHWEAPKRQQSAALFKWVLDIFIGIAVAACAWVVHVGHEGLSSWRMYWTSDALDHPAVTKSPFLCAWLTDTIISASFVFVAVCLCEWQPSAVSSGIPGVIAFLNGIDLKEKLFTGKVLVAKILGVILACGSALAVGPEGPMIHIGATVGVLVHSLLLKHWSPDRLSRSGRALELHAAAVGAGCGITAAFQAPIAGMLFVVEEATAYSSPRFHVHVFGAGCIALAFVIMPEYITHPGNQYTALFQVSKGPNCAELNFLNWQYLTCTLCIGLVCGGLGCIFNAIVLKLNKYRHKRRSAGGWPARRYFFVEALFLSLLSTSVGVFLPWGTGCLESTVQRAFKDSNQCIQGDWADQIFHDSWKEKNHNPVPGLFGLQYSPVECPRVLYHGGAQADACNLERHGLVFPPSVEPPQRYNYCCGFENFSSFEMGKVYDFRHPRAPFRMQAESWPAFGCKGEFDEKNHAWIPHYSPMAALAFVPGRVALKNLFTRGSPELLPLAYLLGFLPFYFLLAATTSGAAIPSGLVVPMMLIGGCTGRLIGLSLTDLLSTRGQCSMGEAWIDEFHLLLDWLQKQDIHSPFVTCNAPDPGACAVIGAAAFMSGSGSIVLLSMAILVEVTADVTFILPIAMGAILGRLVVRLSGRHGLYHELMGVARLPYLSMRSYLSNKVIVVDALVDDHRLERAEKLRLSQDRLVKFPEVELAGRIQQKLSQCLYHGFPVVSSNGKLVGLARREDLEARLRGSGPTGMVSPEPGEGIDLTPIMDAAPYTVREDFPIQRAHHICTNLWLRHLVVVNEEHKPVGILTRRSFVKMQQKWLEHF